MQLCAPFRSEDLITLEKANGEADLIELRLDLFKPKDLKKMRSKCKKPVIFTLKEPLESLLDLSPEYLDLPSTTPKRVFEHIRARYPRIQLICSYHDFEKMGDLESIYSSLCTKPAHLYKIATTSLNTLDALKMLQFIKKERCIGVCMGEFGELTRILAPLFGAPWTYAPLTAAHKTAPGQLLLEELVETYNMRLHKKSTPLFGLIGDPVSKSRGHKLHNENMKQRGVYVKMRVGADELKELFVLCKNLGFRGLSVTMPLKEAVVPFLDQSEDEAVNTLGFSEQIVGWNTDGRGALNALEKRGLVFGKKVVLLGAGGAAIGIAKEAKKRGAELVICNRTLARAKALAEQVGGTAFSLQEFSAIASLGYDILINCTSIGMGEDLRSPVAREDLLPKRLVMDIISYPRQTPLLRAAQIQKCRIIEGREMFDEQARLQQCHWFQNTGK
ncbi:MAG: Shikimate dehydrogenase (NADP(+)) [Chlamydiales bacterium]|nr:Shikimate dehydrogenase (NADP(+)) [Chlamydiales bacterium]